MGGIQKIAERLERDRQNRMASSFGNTELILKDGDQAYVRFVPNGSDDSPLLDDAWVHSVRAVSASGKQYYRNVVCFRVTKEDPGIDCSLCESGDKTRHVFGIWSYVYSLRHPKSCGHEPRGEEKWKETVTPGGVAYRTEEINGFRIFTRGFGFNESLWNMMQDLYQDTGDLSKYVVRIKRTGAEMKDTTYTVQSTGKTAPEFGKEDQDKANSLMTVLEYLSRDGKAAGSQDTSPVSVDAAEDEEALNSGDAQVEDASDDDLF